MCKIRSISVFVFCVFISLLFSSAYLYAGEVSSVNELSQTPADTSKTKSPISSYSKNTYEDLNAQYPMDAPNPDNIKSIVEYDPISGMYILRTYVGDIEISTPYSMSEQEYYDYSSKQAMQRYWREKEKSSMDDNENKFSLTDIKFDIGPADKIFGPGGVQLKTQGSAELRFGLRHTRTENPSVPARQRKNTSPDFDQKIQLNVNAKVGTRINFDMNYNTESTFSFDQKMLKLGYQGEEDDIIQNVEAGNVSMQLNTALISGSSTLFGVKTDLKFGKLKVSAIASQQQSESQRVNSRGGAQTTDFEINIDQYEENRHFFIAHYFRDNFESAMSKLPYVSSVITINKIEVWVTNKRGSTENVRNIIAFSDLAESDITRISKSGVWTPLPTPNGIPINNANSLYGTVSALAGIRNIQQVNDVLGSNFSTLNGGEDYEKIGLARLLQEGTEYTFNPALGIISLKYTLNPDEVLAVAFEYTYSPDGRTYYVGELSTGSVKDPETLIVKLLKASSQVTGVPMWDLMMKNIYNLGSTQIQQDGFELNIIYRNDSIGTELRYISEGNIKNRSLLRVMNLDRLTLRGTSGSDGKFDYVEGYTIDSSTGRFIFPILEPFGEYLRKQIGNDAIADNYVYEELYSMTQIEAQEFSEKNKFRIVGKYKGSSGKEIRLNAMNIPRGSVMVTAGGVRLVENQDYTVDYMMGTVTILNQSLLESNTNIEVSLENQSTFNLQRKSLFGTHLEYEFSKNFSLGGTLMHMKETPLTTKVNLGSEPVSNTIWGLNSSWRAESQWLTNIIDKLPFVNATQPSSIAINAEFAHLIPGHPKVIGEAGYAYIDDFEAAKTTIDMHYPRYWCLSSTPSGLFPEAKLSNNVEYGYNRALLAWYDIDPVLNNDTRNTPAHLRNNPDLQSNHLTRNVLYDEIYPNRQILSTQTSTLTVMNLSFYPNERGPYNLDLLNPDGTLPNPEKRWGGIMRKVDVTDFESSNIEYIEFWLLDPFINDIANTHAGGDLYFDLGDICEDILKDGKKFFENGLDVNGDFTKNDTTVWGYVPRGQSIVRAFDATDRTFQDIGLNGLRTVDEYEYGAYKTYRDNLFNIVTDPIAQERFRSDPFSPYNDPGGDNFHHYLGSDYDAQEFDILARYKRFNGTEGNSPINDEFGNSTKLPDTEDINEDNTLNEYEKFFRYKVSINRDSMQIGTNGITDIIEATVTLPNGSVETVRWYQFKVPLSLPYDKEGSPNFRSIRFMRMFLTNFNEDIHLRFATLDFVRGEWRTYTQLHNLNDGATPNGKLDVLAVNIEENANKVPVNYVLPPGVSRQTTPGQVQVIPQNEQAMVLKVTDMYPKEALAVFKKTSYDMRQYKRLQMFIHAERLENDNTNLQSQELTCFIRLGSDMVNNYYEYEIPLVLTPHGTYNNQSRSDREAVWPTANMFDFPFTVLTSAKQQRNKEKQVEGSGITNSTAYITFDPDNQNNKITVKGNPTISEVRNIMIGIRNNSNNVKSGEIWVNELRMSEFDDDGGWAAMGNMALALSDIATVNIAGRKETTGFGSVESRVQERRMDDLSQLDVSASADLGRFLPEKAHLIIPTFFSYSNEKLSPKYNPLDEDILLSDALDALETKHERDSLNAMSNTITTSKSFNVTNAKLNLRSKTPQFYDPANVGMTYAYIESNQQTPDIEKDLITEHRIAWDYSYTFKSDPIEPFKKIKALDKPAFKLIKDINFYYLPASIRMNTQMNRQFTQIVLRDFSGASTTEPMELTFSRDFMWSRQFGLNHNLTRGISLSFQAATNANVIESEFTPEIGREYYENWRDTVWSSIKKGGRPYTYNQSFNASWNIPINKIPIFSWINANASYNANYIWNRSADIEEVDLMGNAATSMGAWQANGQFNFEQLYGKFKPLKAIDDRMKQKGNRPKFEPKTYTETVVLKEGQTKTINHRLGSNRVRVTAVNKNGRNVNISYEAKSPTAIEIKSESTIDSLVLTIVSQDPNYRSPALQVVDFTVRALMMVRRASITYRQSNNMTIPSFLEEPSFLGQTKDANGVLSPGIGFAFGFFDENNTLERMKERGWLLTDSISNPSIYAYSADLDVKVSIEPIVGFKIELNGKHINQYNKNTQYAGVGGSTKLTNFTGNFSITQVAIKTAFRKYGSASTDYNSKTFNEFLTSRSIIKARLDNEILGRNYPSTGFLDPTENSNYTGQYITSDNFAGFSENSADVLIPAFLAAYTGRNPDKVDTNPFLSILSILPNWRITYDGLSRIRWIKERFRSVTLTHGYTCQYTIGSYNSFSSWVPLDGSSSIGFVEDVVTASPIPSMQYSIPSVSIIEQFSPLIGVNVAMINSVTTKIEYRKQRNLTLNITNTQLMDGTTDEFVVGFGYTLKDFNMILRLKSGVQSKVKNDLKLTVDVSFKDNKMLIRKIEENLTQATSGNKVFGIKVMADYVFSAKVNLQMYFDHQSTTPLISSTYPVSNTNFGIGIKFMLTR